MLWFGLGAAVIAVLAIWAMVKTSHGISPYNADLDVDLMTLSPGKIVSVNESDIDPQGILGSYYNTQTIQALKANTPFSSLGQLGSLPGLGSPLGYYKETYKNYYDYQAAQPQLQKAFNIYMQASEWKNGDYTKVPDTPNPPKPPELPIREVFTERKFK